MLGLVAAVNVTHQIAQVLPIGSMTVGAYVKSI